MGEGEGVSIEPFTIGREPAVEAIRAPIEAGSAATTGGMGWSCQGSSSNGSGKENTRKHQKRKEN